MDADPDGPQPWLVTAYVAGPSLADAVEARGAMPVESVLTLAAGLAEGLGAVHAAGVVHRDLKPSNVLLASDGPRIIDFGISRAADSAWLTNAGGVVGSPGFMSPEQAEGSSVGPATDIFSLGGVLAFAATGQPPFGAGPASALLYRVVYGTAATGHVPARLRPLVERCLAKDPADRPSTDELLAELGYAEPSPNWLSWQAPLARRPAAEPPATEVDQRGRPYPGEDDALAGNAAVLAGSGPPGRSVPPTLSERAAVSRPVTPARGGISGAVIGTAVAAVLAAGVAGAVAYVVTSHSDHGRGAASSPPPAHVRTDTGTQPAAAEAQGSTATGPKAVVDFYFAAIDRRNWPRVWRLGGDNLNSSYQGMVDGYASTNLDVIRSIRVVGDHAFVRVRALETGGVVQVYEMDFLIQDGVIVHGTQLLLGTDG